MGREKFILDGVNEKSDDKEVLSAFIKQHYALREGIGQLPPEIVIPTTLPDFDEVQLLLHKMVSPKQDGENSSAKLVLHSVSEENRRLMKLAQDNAGPVLTEEESKGETRKRERLRSLKRPEGGT